MRHGTPEADRARPARSRLYVAVAWLLATSAALAVLLIGATRAEAGTYRVAECHPGLEAGHDDFTFARTSDHYRPGADCAKGGGGLTVSPVADGISGGRTGSWTLPIPGALELVRARMKVSGHAKGGHLPELVATDSSSSSGAMRSFGRAGGDAHVVKRDGPAEVLGARLRCARSSCGPGRTAKVALRRVMLTLRDGTEPEVGFPVVPQTVRGAWTVKVGGADSGSGVRRAYLDVNGKPVGADELGCDVVRGVAIRLRPCPREAKTSFVAPTVSDPFRQGMNVARACVADYSNRAAANSSCQTRRIRVDNDCPVDGGGDPGHLQVRLRHDRRSHPGVTGKLTGDGGLPLANATVCIAQTPRVAGAAEHVVATPETDGDGRFDARLPGRPSREVRVAFWPDEDRVAERYLRVRVPARPRLRVRPKGALRNGQRAHFRAALPGPVADHRRVSLRVRSGGRWLRVRDGHTNGRGRWQTRYRFRATTERRTYRFRVFVPHQEGYPYAAGRSQVRKVRVEG